jgi:hypothetical protein
MKVFRFLSCVLAILFLLSCSKDTRFCHRIDGTWTVTTFEDAVMVTGNSISYTFDKARHKKGTGNMAGTGIFSMAKTFFDYEVSDQTLTINSLNGTQVFTIKDFSRSKITLLTQDNKTTVLQPK